MKNKVILVTGASGYVGMKVYNDLQKAGFKTFGTYKNNKLDKDFLKVDLTSEKEVVEVIDKVRPQVIVHLAADAHSKTCEDDPENAKKINVESTRFIATQAKKKGIRVIYLSTFACFDPSNVYGKTKYEAEKIVQRLDDYVIIRASLIVGLSPNITSENYFNSLLESIRKKEDIEADTSWEFEMTYLSHLSEIIVDLVDRSDIKNLTIPVVAEGITSRYKIAKEICSMCGIQVNPIDQNRVIPQPDFDRDILKNFGLSGYTCNQCIGKIKEEVKDWLKQK